ncbi:hypothetical protein [Nodularia sp. UHCC 0506]|uniref:hypothetical protein n=1 Tax=Nodularia sp. UHCC 0506 TaxID=3110243 RepID=UPI002B2036F0|nr:hypothetical protein [Nodularia sp. UHCC 0506]MEA5513312.1 hypothetical protein [Nodularia sp. UHCC 0506]
MIPSPNSTQTHSVSNLKTNTNWSNRGSSELRLVKSNKSTSHDSIHEIQKLVNELYQLVEVKRVRAVATSYPDIHWIDFQIELEPNIELSNENWDKIQDLVIDYEWKLIDESAEEWYFRPQIVDKFYSLKDQVIADSETEVGRRERWVSNSLKFSVL